MGIGKKSQAKTVDHLISTYVARRELVPVLKRQLLDGEREIKLEEADVLLDLLRAGTGCHPAMSVDSEGFTTMKQIEAAQLLSQPQINRRVSGLLKIDRKYLETKLPRSKTAAREVRLTEKGRVFAEGYWADFSKFAQLVLAGIDASQRRSHIVVNYEMARKIHGLALVRSEPPQHAEPVDNLMSLFTAAKDIRVAIERSVVLPEEGLSVERADLLVILYVAAGFTSFGELERSLVHSFSPSRHIISRWIAQMGPGESGLVKTRSLPRKRMAAAITQKGIAKVEPILERYNRLAEFLMAEVSELDRKAHLRVNQTIIDSIRPDLEGLITEEGETPF